MAFRSPAVMSMSISRPGCVLDTLVAKVEEVVSLVAHG